MKTRIWTSILILLIFLPILLYGGRPYKVFIYLIAILGLREFIHAYNKKRELPLFIQFISYMTITFIILSAYQRKTVVFTFDFRVLTSLILLYLIPVIFYAKNKKYTISDAVSMIGIALLIGISFLFLIIIRNYSLNWMLYLFIITTMTDVYAYLTGYFIGKHPCAKTISPLKTWEGCIGGTVIATFVAMCFYQVTLTSSIPFGIMILVTILLSILGQCGDLIFSAIKRNFEIKDFSKLLPGHGGILDRVDSILFVALTFAFFMTLL